MGTDWSQIKHFAPAELACSCCGVERMDHGFMVELDRLRGDLGFPLIVSSGYRCAAHNAAVSSTGAHGPHTTGRAVDLAASFHRGFEVLRAAFAKPFDGIGIKQHADGRFVHVDRCADLRGGKQLSWTYA